MDTRERFGRKSREYLCCWNRRVTADPVAAADAISQSCRFIQITYLKGFPFPSVAPMAIAERLSVSMEVEVLKESTPRSFSLQWSSAGSWCIAKASTAQARLY